MLLNRKFAGLAIATGIAVAQFFGAICSAQAQNFDESELIIPNIVDCDKLWKEGDPSPPKLCADLKKDNGSDKKIVIDRGLTEFQRKRLAIQLRAKLELEKLEANERKRQGAEIVTVVSLSSSLKIERVWKTTRNSVSLAIPAEFSSTQLLWTGADSVPRGLSATHLREIKSFIVSGEDTYISLADGIILKISSKGN